eukprot:GFYU01002937.1.p1 GENE.GFYU01002937.1~~GFYU01002937.1.p1  ORF type:complete len:500 (-),score=134.13 GFYU01002937.1:99-1598(-)
MTSTTKSLAHQLALLVVVCLAAASVTATDPTYTNQSGTPLGNKPYVALVNVTVIDGSSTNADSVTRNAALIMQGRNIVDIIPSAHFAGSEYAHMSTMVIQGRNRVVMPGLIDSHVHVSSEWPQEDEEVRGLLRFALHGGITTVRDMGGDVVFLSPYANAAKVDAIASPSMYYSALIGGPSFFDDPRTQQASHGGVAGALPWLRALTTDTNVTAAVQEAKEIGVTGLKIYANLEPPLVAKITAEAHRQGLKVWCHSSIFPSRPSDQVRAGVDVMSHSAYLVWEAAEPMPTSYKARKDGDYKNIPFHHPKVLALLESMRDASIILDATVYVFTEFEDSMSIDAPMATPSTIGLRKPSQSPAKLTRDYMRRLHLSSHMSDDEDHNHRMSEWTFNVTALAHSMGVSVAAGTDDMGHPDEDAYPKIHKELELLVTKCGFTPLEAIKAATSVAARAIGIDQHVGTVQKDMTADLVVLKEGADPTQDITDTTKIDMVFKHGVVHQP